MDRRARVLITIGVVGAMCAPVVLDRDGFPLSTYPMYSRTRGAQISVVTAQAVTADESTTPLTLAVIGNSDDPLIVAGELRAAIRAGRATDSCQGIAARAERWAGLPPETITIAVVTERHDVEAHGAGDPSLVERTVHAECEVAR